MGDKHRYNIIDSKSAMNKQQSEIELNVRRNLFHSFAAYVRNTDIKSDVNGSSCNFVNNFNGSDVIPVGVQKTLKQGTTYNAFKLLTQAVKLFSIIIFYKCCIVAVRHIDIANIMELYNSIQMTANNASHWINENKCLEMFTPLFCGIIMSLFSYVLVYLDSYQPGVNPPTPFSPRSLHRYQQRKSDSHLGYMVAISSGFIVSLLMYHNYFF